MTKILINFSNHPSAKWDAAQREDWAIVIDERFPRIRSESTKEDLQKMVKKYRKRIGEIAESLDKDAEIWLHLVGHWSFCYPFVSKYSFPKLAGLAIPMAERDDNAKYLFTKWLLMSKEELVD